PAATKPTRSRAPVAVNDPFAYISSRYPSDARSTSVLPLLNISIALWLDVPSMYSDMNSTSLGVGVGVGTGVGVGVGVGVASSSTAPISLPSPPLALG